MKIIIGIKMQETYYRHKKANVSATNGGPSSMSANFMNLVNKLL